MEKTRLWGTLHPFFEVGDILGRSVANEAFITALIRKNAYDQYHFFLQDAQAIHIVTTRLTELFPEKMRAGAFLVTTRHALPEAVAARSYEIFHLSDCVGEMAALQRLRNALSRTLFAITGTTHSLSYARFPVHFFDQIWPGVTDRDALIATSTAGMKVIETTFSSLRKGYDLNDAFRSPKLVHIPFGVNLEDFVEPERKFTISAEARKRLGIRENATVFLVFARISHYSKMDVLPMFRALLRAEKIGLARGSYTLILAGWLEQGDTAAKAYVDIAASLGIHLVIVPCPDDALRKDLYAIADIFLSPVDNLQETFGLTLLEAGAASLPVIASDFDGYKDTVVHGETGLLVPTIGPADTSETDALSGVWYDNQYHLQLAQQSVVSVPALAQAMVDLASNETLRFALGAAARKRVEKRYTWDIVVEKYIALWNELRTAPVGEIEKLHPLHPSYGKVFAGYYTRLLDASMCVRWTGFGEAIYRGRDYPAVYGGIERLITSDALRLLLFRARKATTVAQLLPKGVSGPEKEKTAFLVLWSLKHDLLEECGQ